MKKIFTILLLLVLVLGVSGCIDEGEPSKVGETSGNGTGGGGSQVKDIYSIGEEVKLGNLVFSVIDYKFKEKYPYTQNVGGQTMSYVARPEQGKTFIFVKVSAKNTGEDSHYVPSDVYLLAEGSQYETGLTATYPSDMKKYEQYKEIISGVKEEGWVRYEIPEDLDKDNITVAADLSEFWSEKFVKWKLEE